MLTPVEINDLVKQITDEVVGTLEKYYQPLYWSERHNIASDHMDLLVQLGATRIGARLGMQNITQNLSPLIDHTLLKADATPEQVEKLCQEAMEYNFATVCINPCYVRFAKRLLERSKVKVCTVLGFPLGATLSAVKAYEAQLVQDEGAEEIDMVLAVGALKSKGYDYVENDISAVVKQAREKTVVKVILETCLLNDEEKIKACELAKKAGADFVKTSTGFGPSGATATDIALMRRIVGPDMGVKASGGIRDREGAELMVKAGASRIGASASVKIVMGGKGESAY